MTYYRSTEKERILREQIVGIGRSLYERGLIAGGDGNISARLDASRVLCTPSGLRKGSMTPEQLIIVDMDGRKVGPESSASRKLVPTSEIRMHLEAYRQRSDVGGVVHAHPPIAVALSIAGISLADCMLPEVIVNLGLVPTTDYATPASEENVQAIRDLIANHDGVILKRHGALTTGRDPQEAHMRMEYIEQLAQITLALQQLGKGQPLPAEQVNKLVAQRKKMGLMRPGEAEEFCEIAGVCPTVGDDAPPVQDSEAALVEAVTRAVLRELGQTS